MTSHAPFRLEIAACLWETVLNFRDRPPTDPDALHRALAIHSAFDRLGADALRPIVLSWTPKIERAWQDVDDCQRRSDIRPAWRSKSRPLKVRADDMQRAPIGALCIFTVLRRVSRRGWPDFAPPRRRGDGGRTA